MEILASMSPIGLLFIIALELMQAPWLVWLGGTLTVGRVIYATVSLHAWPFCGRAIGFCNWFVYAVAGVACVYYGFTGAM